MNIKQRIKQRIEHILFRLLPPRIFLRLYGRGVKLPKRRKITVSVICRIDDYLHIVKSVQLGSILAVDTMVPLWLECGIILDYAGQRQYFPPDRVVRLSWFDPILNERVTLSGRGQAEKGSDARPE